MESIAHGAKGLLEGPSTGPGKPSGAQATLPPIKSLFFLPHRQQLPVAESKMVRSDA
jgi:hypothetical protein